MMGGVASLNVGTDFFASLEDCGLVDNAAPGNPLFIFTTRKSTFKTNIAVIVHDTPQALFAKGEFTIRSGLTIITNSAGREGR